MKNDRPLGKAQIIHNLTAGNAEHKKDDLINGVKQVAGEVHYLSTANPVWNKFTENDPDALFVGGGDGTVHKVAQVLLKNNQLKQRTPICLLALGTANNIAKTLDLPRGMEMTSVAKFDDTTKFDIGRLKGLGKEHFFLEAAGFGIFPKLVAEMEKQDEEMETASEELDKSMQTLVEVISNYKAESAEIYADDKEITGKFLLVELMNIKFIGPNFEIAPEADVSDGYFDLVLVREDSRTLLLEYIKALVDKKRPSHDLSSFVEKYKVKKLKMSWRGKDVHVDDEPLPEYSGEKFEAEVEPDALRFVKK